MQVELAGDQAVARDALLRIPGLRRETWGTQTYALWAGIYNPAGTGRD
jgi:hypothetical protein